MGFDGALGVVWVSWIGGWVCGVGFDVFGCLGCFFFGCTSMGQVFFFLGGKVCGV